MSNITLLGCLELAKKFVVGGGWVRVDESCENKANLAQLGLELGLSLAMISLAFSRR